jgi:hypothetical protein
MTALPFYAMNATADPEELLSSALRALSTCQGAAGYEFTIVVENGLAGRPESTAREFRCNLSTWYLYSHLVQLCAVASLRQTGTQQIAGEACGEFSHKPSPLMGVPRDGSAPAKFVRPVRGGRDTVGSVHTSKWYRGRGFCRQFGFTSQAGARESWRIRADQVREMSTFTWSG